MRGAVRSLLAAGLVAAALLVVPAVASAQELLVFAAASLKNALDEANAAYQQQGGAKVVASYAASGALAKQLENGAPADLFISADQDWMTYVQGKKLIKDDTRVNLLGNRLVLVGPATSTTAVEIGAGFALASLLGGGRLAMGEPQSVPAGRYGQQALETLGIWTAVQPKVAMTDNVRSALALVSRGEAPFGIVYETDVRADPGTKVVGVFPDGSYPPVIYPVALTAATSKPEAARYLAWLRSPVAQPVFEKQGFQVLK